VTLADLLVQTVAMNGSDLHLTEGSPPRVRVDGELQVLREAPLTAADTRDLVLSALTDAQQARLQSVMELDAACQVEGLGRFRCNAFHQRGTLAAVYRHIPDQVCSLAELGLPPVLSDLARRPRGLVLVTGPTGSGKSTTLAAMVSQINGERRGHILTIEDPIEFVHAHGQSVVNQREVGRDTPTFTAALRAALREDPDVVLVGEMRDLESVEAALRIAETGHLTLATLHTSSAAQTITRIIDVCPAGQQERVRTQVSLVLEGVVCQALLPRAGGGRVAALEVLIPTPAIRNLIRENKVHQIYAAMQAGRGRSGMQTMNHALAALCRRGSTTRDAAVAVSSLPEELIAMLARPEAVAGRWAAAREP